MVFEYFFFFLQGRSLGFLVLMLFLAFLFYLASPPWFFIFRARLFLIILPPSLYHISLSSEFLFLLYFFFLGICSAV